VPQFKDTLGWIHYRRGEYKTALPLLEEAATELPSVGEVFYHLGMNYLAMGEPAKATEKLKKALELTSASTKSEMEEKVRVALQKAGNL
jgi:tetratricopeptide (TPR) repeat protein